MTEPGAYESHPDVYDEIGRGYARHRRPDPRIQAQLDAALGGARRICNVGAGTGSYEPAGCEVTAVEPSREMLAQRTRAAVRGVGEALPFPDDAFDATLAVLTIHHWTDLDAGLAEMRRVAPRNVIFGFDPKPHDAFWLVEYLPEIEDVDADAPTVEQVTRGLGGARVEPILVPWDCVDGFLACYWRRPERYLDPEVRASISSIAKLAPEVVARGISQLRDDLEGGRWHDRHADLLERDTLDCGYRLFVAER